MRLPISSTLLMAVMALTLSAQPGLRLAGIPEPLTVRNASSGEVTATGGKQLRIAAKGETNLFLAPDGKYKAINAPMALFSPGRDFVFHAKVSAQHRGVYDVGALLVFEDESKWVKLCFEASARKQPLVVSVVTRGSSDDTNSEVIESPFVYLAIARKGNEFSLHFSRDGQDWRLVRHFRLELSQPQLGFAVHASQKEGFSAVFSEAGYTGRAPKDMRQLGPSDFQAQSDSK